jgi:hypothetical protein
LVVTPGKDYNNKFGNYRQADFVGIPYGSKVGSRNGKGFVHLLRPTPELWTMALPHRTQILYLADIAFVTSWLDIKPGSLVIEAGEQFHEYVTCAPEFLLLSSTPWAMQSNSGPRTLRWREVEMLLIQWNSLIPCTSHCLLNMFCCVANSTT